MLFQEIAKNRGFTVSRYSEHLTKTGWKAKKRKETEERLAKWQALTPEQQLADLDRRGMRAVKQRTRIMSKIKAK